MYDIFFQSVTSILSIKQATEKALSRLGIKNLRDLLFYNPYSHKIFNIDPNLSNVKDGTEICCSVIVGDIEMPRTKRSPTKIYTSNETGELILVFFNKIPPFIFAKLKEGAKITVAGKVEQGQSFSSGRINQISHPEFVFRKDQIKSVFPVYHLTYGIINKQLYGYILDGIAALEIAINARISFGNMHGQDDKNIFNNEKEYLQNILNLIKQLHLVNHIEGASEVSNTLENVTKEMAALELYANQVSLHNLRSSKVQNTGHIMSTDPVLKQRILDQLGFDLTEGQQKAIAEIENDQREKIQMMRLLQGDVGSGKTLVALLTIVNTVNSGFQACIMAPTDLLSQQHYEFFCRALAADNLKYNIALLTGKTKGKEKKLIKKDLESGNIDILIGTHALFQDNVEFKNLGYIVIDEQHRFGVQQRLDLINKASHPDVLVMTATPIPRSLTLTMFGDMSVSQIKTKPKNRLPIITSRLSTDRREEIITSMQSKFNQGHRVYWVCPLIDQKDKSLENIDTSENINNFNQASESVSIKYSDVTTRMQELESFYPNKGGMLHGKMKADQKDEIMRKFKEGEFEFIVSTTVIEVGIDVPDATLIIIENAEKFGLAQLHQLRGRVGRGSDQSHCMLLYNPKNYTKTAQERLKIMRDSNDGFYIAEQDLILRGGGEILGTRQSGEPDFFFANLGRDVETLMRANKLAMIATKNQFQDFQLKLFSRDDQELVKSG